MLNSLPLFSSLGTQSSNVEVWLFDKNVATITGPTPFVDINRTFVGQDNIVTSITNTITLTGKIVATGLTPLVDKIQQLDSLVKSCVAGSLKIKCDNVEIYHHRLLTVKQMQVDKSDNNWTRFADYTISLESKEPFSNTNPVYVEDRSESWTIEQVEDAQFVEFNGTVSTGPEYLAKEMRPTEPDVNRPVPGSSFLNGTDQSMQQDLQVKQSPQYRITRRLSAKGLLTAPSGACVNSIESINAIKLLNAKNWVENQAALGFGQNPAGNINILPTTNGNGNAFLYNHIRSISADAYNGTYEITDNWIAMPTGIGHTEKYTIECNTAENFTKTIRVIGNINGLALHNPNHMATSGNHYLQPHITNSVTGLKLDLTSGQSNPHGSSNSNYELSNVDSVTSPNTTITNSKYQNALRAWNYDIKPYLYRRASMGMDTGTRQSRPALITNPQRGQSPAFFTERPLASVPVSTSEGHDPLNGTISYTYEFNNKYKVFPGVISENISITHDAPADNISETQIIGRYLGPLLQAIGRTNARKTISVDIIIQPPMDDAGMLENFITCPVNINSTLRRQINELIEGNKPFSYRNAIIFGDAAARGNIPGTVFVQSDQETWNPTEGRFSRTVTWIYQQCLTNINYMDH